MAGSESVGIVSLIDKGAVGYNEFFDSRPETACKGGENGFVDYPFLGGVVGIIINRNQVIEGFDQVCFRFGGVEVGRCRRYGLRSLCFLFLSLSGAALGRSLFRSRLRDGSDGRSGQAQLLVRLKGSGLEAWDEFLVGVREATAAERETWVALLNHQILIRRRWPEA